MRKYVKEFFNKAVEKDKERQKKRADRRDREGGDQNSAGDGMTNEDRKEEDAVKSDVEGDMAISDDEEEKPQVDSATPATPLDQLSLEGLKRKRDQLLEEGGMDMEDQSIPNKLMRSETPPPPPPPPAPANGRYPDFEGATDASMDEAVGTPLEDLSSTMVSSSTRLPPLSVNASTNGTPTDQLYADGEERDDADRGELEANGEDHGYPRPLRV